MNKPKEFVTPRCGIHTISILIEGIPLDDLDEQTERCISKRITTLDTSTGETKNRLKLNLNKWKENSGWCTSYDEFNEVLSLFLNSIGVSEYKFSRVDFSFDYFIDNYMQMHKIHKCICLLGSLIYLIKNRYECLEPLSLAHLSTKIKNEYIEIENYNKSIESNYLSPVKNRFEIRSKSLSQSKVNFISVEKLADDWCNRFDKFILQYDKLQIKSNEWLIKTWQDEKDSKVKNLSEFLRKNQANIYTKKQLIDLYEKLGESDPKGKLKNFNRYNNIEYISEQYLYSYISVLKNSMINFINPRAIKAPIIAIEKCTKSA